MSNPLSPERAFMGELKALLERYDVTFAKSAVYYPGDSDNPRFVFGDDSSKVYLTIDDMADLRGGWQYPYRRKKS